MEANITITISEGETIPCPCCGAIHEIDLEQVCLSLGTCSKCESEIIVLSQSVEVGKVQ